MNHATRQADLFAPQPDLFDAIPQTQAGPAAETVRARLHALLGTARAAAKMPWEPQRERVNALLFHNMANWLPEAERDDLRAAFTAELDRLRAVR